MSVKNDISDLSPSTINNGGALSLPIRTEKIVLSNTSTDSDTSDYHITAAKRAYRDYVMVRLPGRGGSTPGVFNASPATYSFLINPAEVHIQRQTVDQQTLTRAGWQIGLWGEEFITITMNGKTPGKYFTNGLTDFFTPFTESYRNLMALEMVHENNGYWFEGEQVATKLQQTTKRIKTHQDVELTIGEFIWNGMFETMDTTEDADSPFLVDFSLTFIAWKERFINNSPYQDSIGGDVQRGHVPIQGTGAPAQITTQSSVANADLTQFITDPNTGNWTIS